MSEAGAPWERLPAESPQAFAAFRAYLEDGPARSVVGVARECGKHPNLLHRWSANHEWLARAAAWDEHLADLASQEVAASRRSLAARQVRVAREALEKVAEAISGVQPMSLSVAELSRLWELAVRTEREALDLPSARVAVETSGIAAIDMTDEQRRERMEDLRRELSARLSNETENP